MENSFEEVFKYLNSIRDKSTPILNTTGRPGVSFTGYANSNRRGNHIVCLSGKKSRTYIYQDQEDWGKPTNSSGTRIAHYAVPIDQWFSEVKKETYIS